MWYKWKVGICEDDNNVKRFKSDNGIVKKLFVSLRRLFQRYPNVDMTTGKEYLF